MKIKNTILIVSVLSVLMMTSNICTAQKKLVKKWDTYSNKDLNFSIDFPEKPEMKKTKKASGVLTYIVKTKYANETFNISANLHTSDVEHQEGLLEKEFDSFVAKLKGSVQNKRAFECGDYKGLRGDVTTAKGAKINYAIIMAGDRQFQLYIVALKDFVNTKLVDRFFNSFKIN